MTPLIDFHLLWSWRHAILAGAGETLLLGVTALFISFVSGIIGWLLKNARGRVPAAIGATYVELFRNTPTLVFLYLCYFGLPELHLHTSAFNYAALALGIQGGAYVAEIIRGAFSAVSAGQRLAARALGLSAWQSLRLVELPQTFAVAFPALGNQVVATVLGTALASVITVPELTYRLQVIGDSTYQYFSVFAAAALVYVVVVQFLNQFFQALDRRWFMRWRGNI